MFAAETVWFLSCTDYFIFMTKQIASLSVLNKFGSFCESDE